MIIFGSGDYGEAGSLTGIPLTSETPPVTGGSIPFSPPSNLFILRDQGGSRVTLVDGFDVNLALPAPDLHTYAIVSNNLKEKSCPNCQTMLPGFEL